MAESQQTSPTYACQSCSDACQSCSSEWSKIHIFRILVLFFFSNKLWCLRYIIYQFQSCKTLGHLFSHTFSNVHHQNCPTISYFYFYMTSKFSFTNSNRGLLQTANDSYNLRTQSISCSIHPFSAVEILRTDLTCRTSRPKK